MRFRVSWNLDIVDEISNCYYESNMTYNSKPIGKKSQTPVKTATSKSIFDKSSRILTASIALVVVLGFCLFVRGVDSLGQVFTGPLNLFFLPSVPALLVTIFSGLYLYRIVKREPIGKLSVVASIFSVALVCIGFVFLTTLLGTGTTCPVSSNLHQDCGQLNAFMLYVYVNNPISYGLALVLSIAGSIALFFNQQPRERKNK